jgi:hypothetical protein
MLQMISRKLVTTKKTQKTTNMTSQKLISMNALLLSNRLYWIRSTAALRRWVRKDLSKKNILGTIVNDYDGTVRYFIPEDNVEKFVKAFEGGTLFD